MKLCPGCKIVKDAEAFGIMRRAKTGLQVYCKRCRHEYSRINKAKISAINKERYKANPGAFKARAMKRYSENKAECISKINEWQAKNRAKVNSYVKAWKEKHPLKVAEYERRRRIMKYGVDASKVDYEAILGRHGYACHICGGYVAPWDLHMDHKIPLCVGGTHSEDNVAPAHTLCNLRKGRKNYGLIL